MSGEPGSQARTCLVCGQPVGAAADPPICPEHFADRYAQPRRPSPSSWWFHHREGARMLFLSGWRGGGWSPQGVRGDWRVVSVDTGEARSFTNTEEAEVWLDALGVKPASPGAYPDWWGQPVPPGGPDLEALKAQMPPQRAGSGAPLRPQFSA